MHQRALGLGDPLGRFRTVAPHAIVVPREPACSNPGCRYKHRMAVLVAGHWDLHAQGDVFMVDAFDALDALELSGPYVRQEITVTDGSRELRAQAYPAREPERWAELVREGRADALETYAPAGEPELKDCCLASPGHAPPHDVIDPFQTAPAS